MGRGSAAQSPREGRRRHDHHGAHEACSLQRMSGCIARPWPMVRRFPTASARRGGLSPDLAVSSLVLWQSPTADRRWSQWAAQNEGPHISGLRWDLHLTRDFQWEPCRRACC
eukprot:2173962-Prymnesium_polylepis.1